MTKPANIILTLVGTGVISGVAFNQLSHRESEEDDWGDSSQVANQEYQNDFFVPRAGYYHAPFHAFFPYRFNFYDPGRGYYYGGNWFKTPNPSPITSSVPTEAALRQAGLIATSITRGSSHSSFRRSYSSFSSSPSRPVAGSGSQTTPHSSGSGGSSGTHSGSSSVSRGGFGSSSHGFSGVSS